MWLNTYVKINANHFSQEFCGEQLRFVKQKGI